MPLRGKEMQGGFSYPEINLQVSASTKLPVADLEGDGHLIVRVQLFVEAFPRVRFHLDVVGGGKAQQATEGCKGSNGGEQHLENVLLTGGMLVCSISVPGV